MDTSQIILKNLIENKPYVKRVLPYINDQYFEQNSEKVLFNHIKQYIVKYGSLPTIEALYIELSNDPKIPEPIYKAIDDTLIEIRQDMQPPNLDWLIETTEKFCKDRALRNALHRSITIYDGEDKDADKGMIPELLSEALAISFDQTVGHDYLDDAGDRYRYYHTTEERIPTNLKMFNTVTKGGFPKKTLNILLAGPNVGKTAFLCHFAAGNLMESKNVLYITLEMSEEEIAKRIDANLMNITFDDLMQLPKQYFDTRIDKLRQASRGRLIIKQYPTGCANIGNFKALMNELNLKKKFRPDIIYVDYMGIMASFRVKHGANINSYNYIKFISEELRGLAVELNVPVLTGYQLNRSGHANSDPGMEDVADSFAINFTADSIYALLVNDELLQQNLMLVKQIKSRYDDKSRIPTFLVGFDRAKMKFSDAPEHGNQLASNTGTELKSNSSSSNDKFKGLKFAS